MGGRSGFECSGRSIFKGSWPLRAAAMMLLIQLQVAFVNGRGDVVG